MRRAGVVAPAERGVRLERGLRGHRGDGELYVQWHGQHGVGRGERRDPDEQQAERRARGLAMAFEAVWWWWWPWQVLLSLRNPAVLQNVSFHPCAGAFRSGFGRGGAGAAGEIPAGQGAVLHPAGRRVLLGLLLDPGQHAEPALPLLGVRELPLGPRQAADRGEPQAGGDDAEQADADRQVPSMHVK